MQLTSKTVEKQWKTVEQKVHFVKGNTKQGNTIK